MHRLLRAAVGGAVVTLSACSLLIDTSDLDSGGGADGGSAAADGSAPSEASTPGVGDAGGDGATVTGTDGGTGDGGDVGSLGPNSGFEDDPTDCTGWTVSNGDGMVTGDQHRTGSRRARSAPTAPAR